MTSIILCALSSVLLILSFPGFELTYLAWFAFLPWFFAIQKKNFKEAFLFSYLVGILFFAGILYWLIQITIPGFIILVAYLALYFGIFGILANRVFRLNSSKTFLLLPAIWVVLEFARSRLLSGFGWALLGYSQYKFLPIIQIASLTGVWGVSFLVVLPSSFIYSLIKSKFKDKDLIFTFLAIFILCFAFGVIKLSQAKEAEKLKISVIQSNVPQQEKWEPGLKKIIFDRIATLSGQAATEKPDLIIWPETSIPGFLEEDEFLSRALSKLAKDIRIPMLVGAPFFDFSTSRHYNSAYLVSEKGEILARHDKLHLVPFGEYVPFSRIFGFVRRFEEIGDFYPGEEYTLFDISKKKAGEFKFGVLICYEDIFPELVREFAKKGAQFMTVITNDAWFGRSSAPYQHLQASCFRAVENRISIVRSANTGVSCFITHYGRISNSVKDKDGREIMTTGYSTGEVAIYQKRTLYTMFGDWFILPCLLSFLVVFRLLIRGH